MRLWTQSERKVVLITGAANGIGAEVACRLHETRVKLVLTDLDTTQLDEVCGRLGVSRVLRVGADVRDLSAMQAAIDSGSATVRTRPLYRKPDRSTAGTADGKRAISRACDLTDLPPEDSSRPLPEDWNKITLLGLGSRAGLPLRLLHVNRWRTRCADRSQRPRQHRRPTRRRRHQHRLGIRP